MGMSLEHLGFRVQRP